MHKINLVSTSRRNGRSLEGDGGEGTRAVHLAGQEDLLRIGVVIEAVGGQVRVGARTVADGEFAARQTVREQRAGQGIAVAVLTAVHIQTHIVEGLLGEAADETVAGRGGHTLPVLGAGLGIFHMVGLGAGGRGIRCPHHLRGTTAHIGEVHVVRSHTGGLTSLDDQIVNIEVVGAAARSKRTVERRVDNLPVDRFGKRDGNLRPSGCRDFVRIDRLHQHKAAEVGRVGHITGLHIAIARGGRVLPETHHQRLDVVGQVETLETDSAGVGRVGVEVEGAAAGVMVSAGNVRVARITRADTHFRTIGNVAATSAHTFHVNHVRKLSGRGTQGLERLHVPEAVVATATVRTHIDSIVCVAGQRRSSIEGVAQGDHRLVFQRAALGHEH